MKVVFISRSTLYTNPGGDTIQVVSTARHLDRYGITADICLTDQPIDYSKYDLLHFFNIIRPADILGHISRAQKPYVVSTIFVDYYDFERKKGGQLRKILAAVFSPDMLEYLKALARAVLNNEKLMSRYYIWRGQKSSVKKVIAGAALLLPNSHSEYNRLVKRYGVEQRYKVIPNGIDTGLFNSKNEVTKDNNLVLCVARIELRKNQLLLIEALKNTGFHLLIIGKASVNQKSYYEKCREAAGENVSFIDHISQEKLIEYYNKAKVHVLASWFETTGLSSLEAAACGCNIVITDKGDTREYFGEHAFYCDPDSAESILKAVKEAAAAPADGRLTKLISDNYTWQMAAQKTAEAYREIFSKG